MLQFQKIKTNTNWYYLHLWAGAIEGSGYWGCIFVEFYESRLLMPYLVIAGADTIDEVIGYIKTKAQNSYCCGVFWYDYMDRMVYDDGLDSYRGGLKLQEDLNEYFIDYIYQNRLYYPWCDYDYANWSGNHDNQEEGLLLIDMYNNLQYKMAGRKQTTYGGHAVYYMRWDKLNEYVKRYESEINNIILIEPEPVKNLPITELDTNTQEVLEQILQYVDSIHNAESVEDLTILLNNIQNQLTPQQLEYLNIYLQQNGINLQELIQIPEDNANPNNPIETFESAIDYRWFKGPMDPTLEYMGLGYFLGLPVVIPIASTILADSNLLFHIRLRAKIFAFGWASQVIVPVRYVFTRGNWTQYLKGWGFTEEQWIKEEQKEQQKMNKGLAVLYTLKEKYVKLSKGWYDSAILSQLSFEQNIQWGTAF